MAALGRVAGAGLCALIVWCLSPVAVAASSEDAATHLQARLRAADAWLATYLDQEAVPAASVAVIHDQEVLWSRGFGFTDRARRVPASADTRFSICSISKLFTSIAAMKLRDAGKLDLDAPVSTYLPWYPDDSAAATTGPVTVRSILSHVSGMPREASAPYWATREFPDQSRLKDLLERQDANAPAFEHFDYSNLGMVLLGEIVSSLTGANYQRHVQRELLDPLGLSQTTPRWPRELYGTEFALGYAARNGKGERKSLPFYEIGALRAAAGFSSSAADLARFASWQFRVLDGDDTGVLASATLHEMQRIHWMPPDGQGERWGLGFRIQQRGGEMLVGHEGGCPGFTSSFIMRPADKIAVIVLVDVNDVDAGEVALDLYDLLAAPIRAAYPETPVVPAAALPDAAIFEGVYGRPEYHNDIYVLADEGGLMTMSLYARAPAGQIQHYRRVDGTTFRRLRPDGSLAETLRFELNDRGEPVRAWRNNQFLDRRPQQAEELPGSSAKAEQETRAALRRIDALNPTLNAVIAVDPTALDQARRLDRAPRRAMPLFGMPMLIKDNIDMAGPLPTTAGSLALADNVTGRDAPLVARLRAAGAVMLGKANLSEWANIRGSSSISGWSAIGGQTRNPHALNRTPCGSSSGSAVAVAAGMALAAIGTETDGSITCPASVNGIVGYKPTVGLVSRTHIVPISHSQDTAGPMTLTVRDAARILTVIAGTDPSDPTTAEADAHGKDYASALSSSALKGKRLGVMRFASGFGTDAAFEAALATLRTQGAQLVDITDYDGLQELRPRELPVLLAELKSDLDAYLATTPTSVRTRSLADVVEFNRQHAGTELALFGQELFERALASNGFDESARQDRAELHRLATSDGIDQLLAKYEVVALVGPTAPAAWMIDAVHGDRSPGSGGGSLAAVAGYPHLTVPMGTSRGLPVGLSFIGPRWSDALILSLGYAYEQAADKRPQPQFLPSK